ncbi:hypothetical protein TNCV_512921 [Trichonephila clavipes]|nr:hypothetical protein TNCV_512921 [Trichonephila clavipes]
MVLNTCNYSSTTKALISKKGSQRNFDTGPLRASYASELLSSTSPYRVKISSVATDLEPQFPNSTPNQLEDSRSSRLMYIRSFIQVTPQIFIDICLGQETALKRLRIQSHGHSHLAVSAMEEAETL